MDAKEILELVRAGFTKEDIMGMVSAPEQANSPAADPTPAEDVNGGKASEEVPDNSAKEEKKTPAVDSGSVASSQETESKMIAKMDEMIKVMQASNRDAVNNDFATESKLTAEKAVAEFLGGIAK